MHAYGCTYAHLKAHSIPRLSTYVLYTRVSNCKNEYCNVYVTVNRYFATGAEMWEWAGYIYVYMSQEIAAVRM